MVRTRELISQAEKDHNTVRPVFRPCSSVMNLSPSKFRSFEGSVRETESKIDRLVSRTVLLELSL